VAITLSGIQCAKGVQVQDLFPAPGATTVLRLIYFSTKNGRLL